MATAAGRGAAEKHRQLKSVAELEKLRLGNDFILRIADELSRQSVERAQEAEDRLAAVQLENARLRAGGDAPASTNADAAEMQARTGQLPSYTDDLPRTVRPRR